ncbi:glycoside hydrolase family 3 C-terminal domain-containing protein [Salipaludibacillus agaradhaerens]|uniref:Glycoside hydrolase family 3 C-terminal domain-containing protein n=1 Tax=Salipaludibacillus agaradhaerens TaxID=76935 RepID=A0A9Q4B3H3_SALAG|nr:glycoside hydrolase family 3 N-terminal domain-containing protein [Salipaludibacillus agaradhaerens]MCR6097733.1 glycoside hydrolase family 3 C-terminal domain-containing protein [Salipaludibacillus agaradhaerens]MCR6112783.1 glycoside hydrolase family 3 C-terminal domain-containing protein [Salipaludibacillus agaradhaerens]
MGKKKMSKKKFRIIWSSVLSLLLVLAIGVNGALAYYSDVITAYFSEIDITSSEAVAAREHSTEVAAKIADEGIILLQNKESALPFAEGTKVNVFGWSFTDPIYGGAGSGGTDASTAITPKAGLEAAGIEINEELYNAYVETELERPEIGIEGQDFTIPEPKPEDFYTDALIDQAKEFSDTAVLFIARSGGEGADLPQSLFGEDTYDPNGSPQGPTGQKFGFEDDQDPNKHYLELTNRELGMLEAVTENFDNIILVVNSANTFELDWIEDYNQIKSVVNIAGPGQSGFGSLGEVLVGDLNPSGRTVDVYAYDLQDAPAATNFGDFDYVVENADGTYSTASDDQGVPLKYVDLTEGIYVGYRYYETAAEEGSIDYDEKVLYPFGYGLSYTTFDQEVVADSVIWNDTEVSVDVEVTNTGAVAGKEVVQLYYSPPYTGNIERSSINLAAFGKTDELEPGESEVVTVSFAVEDMAAYDHNKAFSSDGAYVLEAGEYQVMLMNNSHEKIADVASQTLSEIVYDETGRSTDEQIAVNQFDEQVTGEGSIDTYLSRADGFANIDEIDQNVMFTVTDEDGSTKEVVGKLVDQEFVDMVNSKRYDVPADTHDTAPTTGVDNGLMLQDFKEVAYDDESWEPLLDQLSVDELVDVVIHGGYRTAEIASVGKPASVDYDGPAGISNFISGSPLSGIPFPAEVMLASTWNIDLAEAMGEAIGAEAQAYGVTGWYGPAMNIHRTAFAGRNFEYYSEDPYLSGKMAAATTEAYQSQGGFVVMKHYALNDQEDNRTYGVLTWGDEQAIREIYLKPFEIAVKEGGALGMMSSFNSIGAVWAGADRSLMTEVLRNEWGFRGLVNTDFFILDAYPYMNVELALRAGNDILLTGVAPFGVPEVNTDSNDTLWAMRDAAKNVMYTIANSSAIDDDMSTATPQWIINTIIINILVGIGIILGFYFTFRSSRKRDEESVSVA